MSSWDEWWSRQTIGELEQKLAMFQRSPRWPIIRKTLSEPSGLKAVELGSGSGIAGLSLAQLGVKVLLIDNSRLALEKARELSKSHGLTPETLQGDILDLEGSLSSAFDISMSFGTVEHYRGKERTKAFGSHYLTLKPSGLSFVSVPNLFYPAYFFSRPIALFLPKSRHLGIPPEARFTKRELLKTATALGYRNREVFGSSISNDLLFVGRK